MTESMIERVTKAITELASSAGGCNSDRCTCHGAEGLECKTGIAIESISIVAIEAMREPTPEMIYAGFGTCEGYRDMIDAALKDNSVAE